MPTILQEQKKEGNGFLKIRFLFDEKLSQKEFHDFLSLKTELFNLPFKNWKGTIDLRGNGNLWVYVRETY